MAKTLSGHFQDEHAEAVETAAKVAGQKVGAYVTQAVLARVESEGLLPGSATADTRRRFEELLAVAPEAARRVVDRELDTFLERAPAIV